MRIYQNHMQHIRWAGMLVLLVAGLACDSSSGPTISAKPATGTVEFALQVPAKSLARPSDIAQTPTQGRVVVSGSDLTTITRVFQAQNGRISGRLDGIPVGQRQVEFSLETSDNTPLWEASTNVNIVKNQVSRATLTLQWVGELPYGYPLAIDLPGGATMDFVWIKPGTFTMGSSDEEEGHWTHEGPQHEVTISRGFYLGKYEITQGQWEAVMGTKPWIGGEFVQDNPDHPAVYISWDDLQAFILRLNELAGVDLYRLPTEAEWAYAARAGTTTRWSFGDDESQLGDYAWYKANAADVGLVAQPVGTKLPNPWGVHDMHGNVLEWVQDWYGGYSSGAVTDPTGSSSGSVRVLRSGFFGEPPQFVRSAHRGSASPATGYALFGARLVRTE